MRYLILFLGISSILYAGWNQDFDEQTSLLQKEFGQFQQDSYSRPITFFREIRKKVLRDLFLERRISIGTSQDKWMARSREGIICKKRRENNIRENTVWELSCLLGLPGFIVPSFPLELGGKKVVLQRLEDFSIGEKKTKIQSQELLKKVSLLKYWESHFLMYILGIGDLVGRNIGVTSSGDIRLFDVEASLKYQNKVNKQDFLISPGFVSQSLDWPHYRMPLQKKEAESLVSFIGKLDAFQEDLKKYRQMRSIELSENGIRERIENIKKFPVMPGVRFRDFYGSLFPQMNSGLNDLNHIIGSVLERTVDHGTSLLFLGSKSKLAELTSKDKKIIKKWIDVYVE